MHTLYCVISSPETISCRKCAQKLRGEPSSRAGPEMSGGTDGRRQRSRHLQPRFSFTDKTLQLSLPAIRQNLFLFKSEHLQCGCQRQPIRVSITPPSARIVSPSRLTRQQALCNYKNPALISNVLSACEELGDSLEESAEWGTLVYRAQRGTRDTCLADFPRVGLRRSRESHTRHHPQSPGRCLLGP